MDPMQHMLAYNVQCRTYSGGAPSIKVGYGSTAASFTPKAPQDDSYWFAFMDVMKPTTLVKDFVIPGQNNSTVPPDLDAMMGSPKYIFAVVTQFLSTLHVPQGDLYDLLARYGAGRALQRLEQVNTQLGCGSYSRVFYLLTGMCGPRGGANAPPPPPSYELGSISSQQSLLLLMSLMPSANGQGPYSICDSNTFKTR